MFRIENIEFLYCTALLPIIGLFYYGSLVWKKKQIKKFGEWSLVQRLMGGYSEWKNNIKFIIWSLAGIFFLIAAANPQWGYKKSKAKAKSTDVFVALDISQSMLAKDISPSRLERSKRFITNMLKKLKSERVGLIFFAGNAYLQVPVTHDVASVELFVKSANTGQAGTQGTAIAQAINLAQESLNFEEEDQAYKKALILITDGENHDAESIQAAREAREKGLVIYTIGVGTEEGDFVQVLRNGYKEYKKDRQGNPVKTRLNTTMIKDVAEAGGGLSYLINNESQVISDIVNDIGKLEKKESELQAFSEYNSYYQYFLFLGLMLLILEYLISSKKSKIDLSTRLFGKDE